MFFTQEDYRNIEEYLRQNSKKDTDFPTTQQIKEDDYIPIIQDAVNKKMTIEDLRINLSKGPRGESAYEVAVRHGYVGTEEQWLASLEGKSAYQIAVELGYVGTEAEWIASLKGAKGDKGDPGKDGIDADIWTIGADDFWYVNGKKTIFKSRGEDGKSPLLRISTDGQSLEISSDGGQTWLPFEKNFNKLRVLGYVSSVQLLPRNANIGDIYGVWNPDVYSGRVDEEGNLIKGAYDLYVNTVRDWVEDYHITKVYDYDTELPSSAANGTTVLVPVDYLTLDKTKIDGYKVYRFSLDKNGWVLILDTAEIYASKDDIINYGDNVYALVQGDEEHTYELYRRDVDWVYFGTNASITYVLVQDIDEGTEINILSGKAIKDAYGRYIETPEFIRLYLDDEDKILWGIKTDGTVYFGAGVPPQVKDYIEERIGNYDDIITFLDDLEEGDETLRELLNEKVDKEEGKSLIDEEYAEGVHYIENPEFVEVKLDQDERILEAIMPDGTKLLPAGYEVDGNVVKTISNPEYLAVWLDSADCILFALKADGDVIFGCGVPSQIKNHVNELIKPFEELFHYEDNPEFVDVKLDSEGKILEGIGNDGTKYLGSLNINGITYSVISNPEWLKAVVDFENKVVCGIKSDGTFCVVDIDFLSSSSKIREILSHFDTEDNSEFLSVELDANEKILGGRKIDGTKFENAGLEISGTVFKGIDDPEDRIEVRTDSDEKIISYRKKDGTLVENVGIETNHLELTEQGMSDFQQALKNAGFHPGGAGDFSDYISNDGEVPLYISEPRCAYINISGVDSMPISKNVDLHASMEVYDYNGNYFKKKVVLNAQGNSSLSNPQKNFAVDMFDSDWDGDAFSLKIGNWVPQDSYHFKCFYYDPTRGLADILYKFAENIIKHTDTRANRLAKDEGDATVYTDSGTFNYDYDTEVLCHPDGFPAVVYLNGEFYGLFTWNLKKHRDNYMMDKKDYESIHIDSDTANLWSSSALDWTQFEIRNPKTLICMDGSKYDGDSPQELIDATSPNYDASNKDHKNTVKTKNLINTLHTVVPMINAASTTEEKKVLFEQYFDVDSFIVFWIISQVIDNYDGLWGRNTQWLYYKKSGKWCPTLYDLDSCLGYLAGVPWLRGPLNEVLATSTNLPYGLLWSLYQNEIRLKYKELRTSGLISSDVIVDMVIDWCNRFGKFNIERNIKKWNTPCYRDGKINGEYWELDGYNLTSNVRESEKYDNERQYNTGDLTYFGVTSIYTMRYKCKAPCVGEIPAGRYNESPFYGGCFDSPRRIKKWMDGKIEYLDNLFD